MRDLVLRSNEEVKPLTERKIYSNSYQLPTISARKSLIESRCFFIFADPFIETPNKILQTALARSSTNTESIPAPKPNLFSVFLELLRVTLCILMRSLVVYSNEIVYKFKWHETHTSVVESVNNFQSPHEKCFDNSIIMPTHNFWFNGRQFVTASENNSKPQFRVLSWSPHSFRFSFSNWLLVRESCGEFQFGRFSHRLELSE